MSFSLNKNPELYAANGACVQKKFDFLEMKNRKSSSTSSKYKMDTSNPYKIKRGDIVFSRNNRDEVIGTLNNIELISPDDIFNSIRFVGFAFRDFDPSTESDLPVLVTGNQRVSIKDGYFNIQKKLKLKIPKDTDLNKKTYPDGRITLGLEEVDENSFDRLKSLRVRMRTLKKVDKNTDKTKTDETSLANIILYRTMKMVFDLKGKLTVDPYTSDTDFNAPTNFIDAYLDFQEKDISDSEAYFKLALKEKSDAILTVLSCSSGGLFVKLETNTK